MLISPVVAPLYHGPNSTSDPFEPFGRALAERHPWVRHITYTKRAGITGTHVAFIKRARAVIFVISGPPGPNEPSQAELAEVARLAGKPRPQIVLACCNIQTNYTGRVPFPTLVKTRDYSPHELRTAAGIILGDEDLNRPISLPPIIVEPPKTWRVEDWTIADMPATYDLWCRSVPAKFHISQSLLASILNRDGWSRHYVVRNPMDRQILGFCATYTTYADAGEERLIGSLALILVNEAHRRRGIGRSLHDQALTNLRRTRGVSRLQLGTTFPRLFYGPPAEMTNSLAWFKRRGWTVDQPVPGKGQEVSDWIVRFEDLPQEGHISMAGLTFRSCDFSEYPTVLGIVERECARKDLRGWYDPYGVLRNTMNIRDIIVGLEGQTVVAAALIYSSNSDAPIKYELPWASVLGKDVGGVSCIFIAGKFFI